MSDPAPLPLSCFDLPLFFDERHRALGERLLALGPELDRLAADGHAAGADPARHADVARRLGAPLGLFAHLVPEAHGGAPAGRPDDAAYVDVRALVLVREALAERSPLADALFAVQGLGSYPVVLAGTREQQERILPGVISGDRIAAFALTEPEAGSDVASLRAAARREGETWVLDGDKTLISNAGIADHHVVFATADPALGRKGITAFLVPRDAPGLQVEPIAMPVPHPIGALRLRGCRVGDDARLGDVGGGLRLAMRTLEAFRISVGAAAVGMARAALRHTLLHVTTRRQFGAPLSEQQMVKAYLAEMATELDAARLLVLRAAHRRDTTHGRVSTEAAMAKLFATEAAQRIIDRAVQLHGGRGVTLDSPVERLYREVRPLRIYEGTSEIQKLVIAAGYLAKER